MTQAIADRLRVLANAVADGRLSEFNMRIPAEPDRDADIVLSRAARRLEVAQRLADALAELLDAHERLQKRDFSGGPADYEQQRDRLRAGWPRARAALAEWEDAK